MLNLIVFRWDEVIIYLRKSRADNPSESVEEVLAKHEKMLQEKALKEFGHEIPEENIYREVVSGETLAEREEMQKVLSKIENPNIKAVMVVEPQRLSRGDLEDCGRVVNAFKYSNTQVITLQMTYDLNNKMHRKFFEQELMRGNDYLEYTKEILLRGRIASVQKGNYISNIAPFGFKKIEDDIGPTLEHDENADAVKLAFEMYVNQDKSFLQIARHLDSLGVKPMIGDKWTKSSIRQMLCNPHYMGLVRFGFRKTERTYENGEIVKKRNRKTDNEEVIVAKGRHKPIVSEELFKAAQEKFNNNPRRKWDAPLQNPLAGLFFCHECDHAMTYRKPEHAKARYECRHRKYGCKSSSVFYHGVIDSVAYALEHEHLPELEAKLKNNDGLSANIQKKQLEKLNAELEEMIQQEDKQFELLEKGIYKEEVFMKRNEELHRQMDALKSKIYEVRVSIPKEVNYEEKIVKLKDAIASLNDDTISAEAKNKVLKTIIEKIEYEFIRNDGRGKIVYKLHIFLLL